MLIVTPEQRHIIGHLQSMMIGIKHLLVSTKNLRNLFYCLMDVTAQNVALIVNGLLHQSHTFCSCMGSLHRIIMDTAQTNDIGVLIFPVDLNTLLPIILHHLAVGYIVKTTKSGLTFCLCPLVYSLPLSLVIAQHLFTVRRSHHDRIVVCQTCVFRIIIEGLGPWMHGRPKVVGFQTQQQLKNLLICLWTNFPLSLFEMMFSPARPSAKALVVNKDPAILYCRFTLTKKARFNIKYFFTKRLHISPPIPW